MASIIPRPGGHHWIQLRVPGGRSRHTIRLGRCSRRDAESIRGRVESLAIARELGVEPDVETATWLARCGDALHRRLAAAGLAGNRARADVTFAELSTAFLSDYRAGSAHTKETIHVSHRRLMAHFGDDTPVRSITVKAADKWREAATAAGYSTATIDTDIKKARQLWKTAIAAGIASTNPWKSLPAGDQANPARKFYIPVAVFNRILEAAPDDELRLILALSRFGGLRFKSEHLQLTVGDIDWPSNEFIVHGKGKKIRRVPIFASLRPYLRTVVNQLGKSASKADSLLIGEKRRLQSQNASRKEVLKILRELDIAPWPKTFHNLRASCETDLARDFAPHVYSEWLGNSPTVAAKHYLQVTDDDRKRAVDGHGTGDGPSRRTKRA